MSTKQEEKKIDWSLLTPEAAYKRITEMADKISANYPNPLYREGIHYKFDWDENSIYIYSGNYNIGSTTNVRKYLFTRISDGKVAILTKYSFLPQDQPEVIE